jgi:hypothetical protein
MTEGFLSSSRLTRLLGTLAAAALVAVAGVGVSMAVAAPPAAVAAASAPRPDAGGPRWAELSPAHRKVLAPLAADWDGLDGRSKERWIDVAGRYPKMAPDAQQRANQRMGEWAHMTVAQRTQARMNFQETRGLSREEREARWKAYQALPEERKRELAAKRAAARAGTAPASAAQGRRHAPPPLGSVQPKNNVVGAAAVHSAAGSAPAAPQHPGVTTTLPNRRASPPAHQHDGAPKIAAGPNAVDRTTLLPKHGLVAAAGASAPSAGHR